MIYLLYEMNESEDAMMKVFGWFIGFIVAVIAGIFIIGGIVGYSCATPSIDSIKDTPCASVFSNGKSNPKYTDMLWKCSTSRKCDGAMTVNQKTCDCECK